MSNQTSFNPTENNEHVDNSINLEKPHTSCLICNENLTSSSLYKRLRVCPSCRYHYSITARRKIAMVAEKGTFKEINKWVESNDPLKFSPKLSYKKRIAQDQVRTKLNEAVITGTCRVGGSNIVLVVLDSGFMGGSMGLVVGEKVSLALEYAAKKNIPAVALVTSAGKRIQEGILSLTQMAKTVIAAKKIKDKKIPFLVHLGNPCTGQVLSSFASMGDIILAEPQAHVGLSSLGELREIEGKHIDSEHVSETYFKHGHIDKIVERPQLKNQITTLLDLISPSFTLERKKEPTTKKIPVLQKDPWETVKLARRGDRPDSKFYITQIFSDFIELHGDRISGDDDSVILGVGRIEGQSAIVAAQQKTVTSPETYDPLRAGQITPEGFRKAQRGAKMAETFGLPFITLIDTAGPKLGIAMEYKGIAGAIASMINQLSTIKTRTISVIIGEGGSEAALAFGISDRVLMMENAIYTQISPELGARTEMNETQGTYDIAGALKLTSFDCLDMGIIDGIINEPTGGAHLHPTESARLLKMILIDEISELNQKNNYTNIKRRYKKFRNIGDYNNKRGTALKNEIGVWRKGISVGLKSFRESKD